MKKILVISSEISHKSGWGRVALEVSKCFKQKDLEVINICGSSTLSHKDIAINDLVSLKQWNFKKVLLTFLDLFRVLLKVRNSFDYILATDESSLMLAHFISKFYKVPFSFISYGTYALKIVNELNVDIHKKALERADKIFISSSFSAQQFKKLTPAYNNKIIVIPLGTSNDFLNHPFSNVNKNDEIVTIGAVKERKGLLEIAQAINLIDEINRPIVNVIGALDQAETYVKNVINFIDENNLKKFIKFHHQIPDNEMLQVIDQSKIFVLPSKNTFDGNFEGFGIVFLEASSRSLPVIGSNDCGNIDAIINNQTGFLINQGDVIDLKDKILYLLKNSEFASNMGKNGRLFAEKMTWMHTTEMILKGIEK